MEKFTFIGCSITRGVGLPNEEVDENNYANLVGKYFNANVVNLSSSGNSNYNIFINGLNELLYNTPDVLFLQWSGLQRHWLYPNLDTTLKICPGSKVPEINYLGTVFPKKILENFIEQFMLLNHDYHNILSLLNYCRILETVAKNQTVLVFINGLIPWTEEILNKNSLNNSAKNFSEYTKDLLSIDMLPDEDIALFFNKINAALDQVDKKNWTNMFIPLIKLAVDFGLDGSHPGPKSHQLYADMIIKYLEEKNV